MVEGVVLCILASNPVSSMAVTMSEGERREAS